MAGLFIALIIILLIVFFIRTSEISKKVSRLEQEILRLKKLISSENFETVPPPASVSEKQVTSATHTERKKNVTAGMPSKPESITPVKSPGPSRTRAEWESLIGGKLLNRIGAVALIIAVGFFLKYAFDNDWINETTRITIGGFVGFGLLFIAYRFKNRGFEIFAQGLVGAGIAILYLSVYAAYNFYYLFSQPLAIIIMSVITGLAFLQAILYNAAAVSILGLIGGMLTPLLLSSGQPNEIGLFTYFVLLNAGIILIALKNDAWWFLEPLALISTFLIYSQWYGAYFDTGKLITVIIYLTIIWFFYFILDIYRILKSHSSYFEIRRSFAAANGLVYFSLVYLPVDQYANEWMGMTSILIAGAYAGAYLWIKKQVPDNSKAHIQYALSAVALLIAATTIQFSGYVIVILWLFEAIILLWLGNRSGLVYLWWAGFGIYLLSLLKLLFSENTYQFEQIEHFRLVLNLRVLAFVILSIAAGSATVLCRVLSAKYRKNLQSFFLYSLSIAVLWLLTVEVRDYFRSKMLGMSDELQAYYLGQEFLLLAAVWMAHALIFIWLGLRKKILPFIYTGIFSIMISILEASLRSIMAYTPIRDFSLLFNYRALIITGLILGSFIQINVFKRNRELYSWIPNVQLALQIALIILCFTFLTGEIKDYFDRLLVILKESDDQVRINLISNLKQLVLSGVWLLYSIVLMVIGIWKRKYAVRVPSIVLFGLTILKIFIYDLSFLDTFYRIFSFFGLGLILLLVSYLYNRYRAVILS